jgi:serine/threonine-protein kinase
VGRGAIVDLRVSSGPGAAHVSVPSVVDLTYEAAVEALQRDGFVVTRREAESEREAEIVIGQAPSAGTQAVPGSAVTVTVSKGDPVTVPDVVGQAIDEAKQTLLNANLEATAVPETTSEPNLHYIVIKQDPPAGEEAQPGDSVTLTYGKYG